MDFNTLIQQSVVACIGAWDFRENGGYGWSIDVLNDFLNKYESVLQSVYFPKGLRVQQGTGNNIPRSQRIDGMLGIVDMNIRVLRSRLQLMQNQPQPMQNHVHQTDQEDLPFNHPC
jgi:hypothetical protein